MAQIPIPNSKTFDWTTLAIYLCLVIIGWLMLYSTTYNEDSPYAYLDLTTDIGKQGLWIIISLIAFVLVLNIEWNFWNTFAYPIYFIAIVLLILVVFFGNEIKGAKSWFNLGFFSFQPSEIAKMGTCLALSSFMSFHKNNLGDRRVLLISLGIFILPILLILLQPDAGSALVFTSFLIILYRKGLSPFFIVLGFILMGIFVFSLIYGAELLSLLTLIAGYGILLFNHELNARSITVFVLSLLTTIIFFNRGLVVGYWMVPLIGTITAIYLNYSTRNFRLITLVIPSVLLAILFSFTTQFVFDNVLEPHQQERINVWLRPERCDPRGSLYNIIQSKLAIGSGGFQGKGFLQGEMTKLNYVPEQTTDFIFSTVGEEQGFIGSVSVVLLFLIMLYRIVMIAERSRLEFIRNFAYGVAGIIFVHFFVNIGMTVGIMPVIGIPLPFLSKGGSSLLTFSIIIAMVLRMDAARYRG